MKSFVITIMKNAESVASAHRCIESMPNFAVSMMQAYTPEQDPEKYAKEKGIPTEMFKNQFSRYLPCLSAFLSHHECWEYAVKFNEEVQIFEHDAVCVGSLPEFISHKGCISLGAPSYGKYYTPQVFGVNKLVSKQYFPGAHAYRVSPQGAKKLIEKAKTHAQPTDVFLNNKYFDFLEEYYPWPVIAKDSFSTIQNKTGCLAKHNYNEGYRLI